MADLVLGASQSSHLLLPHPSKFQFHSYAIPSRPISLNRALTTQNWTFKSIIAAAISDSQASSIVTDNVDLATQGIDFEPDTGGGGDNYGDIGGGGGGGSGGGGDPQNEPDNSGDKKKMALSMSQKLTLGYAALVGMGGFMGYLKSGSQKSLLAGGLSASMLYYVYTQLPTNPVFASSLGLGVSVALVGVMGSRFMRSKKVFPAGVVSLVSLVMTAGYLHGIMRSAH